MSAEFFALLESLAPEGETLLYVLQKPHIDLFHKDGAQRYTWPAFLPSKRRPKGAVYVNTASFIKDRMTVKISAAAANATHCLFLVLDDVGTKSKVPDLKPTWKIETSPGNYQWGYVFNEQPTTGEFSAAIKAIAAAGYTDEGAINPVRNVRVPGSINLKPGRDNFAAILTEFNPEVDYTLEQICSALGVTPAEADTAVHRSMQSYLNDDGTDDVLAWVAGRGDMLEPVNPAGWAGVRCPNYEEHTDGNEMGRYAPLTRAYTCLHAHCVEWDSAAYLEWVADMGGPVHRPGLRDTILADAMAKALGSLSPTEAFSDEAAKIVKEVERKELGRIQKADWWSRFAYVQTSDAYFDLDERRLVSRGTFNALFRHIDCRTVHGNGKKKIEASVCFDENRQEAGAPALVGVTYAAGESVLVARDGLVYGNQWIDARLSPSTGDITPWLDLLNRIVPEQFEREHLLDVMAYKYQHPEVKINHAILLAGGQGAGKDTLLAPFIRAICGPSERNKTLINAVTLSSTFTYYAETELLVVNELRPDDFKDRRALENTLKPVIAAPPEYLTVNKKGSHPYEVLNRVLVLAMSNFRDAIALPPDDRRWFVLWTYAPLMDKAEAKQIWDWYKAGGFEAITGYLASRDVSQFNPGAAPPMTEAKQIMSQQSMSPAESYILGLIEGRIGEFSRGAVGAPFQALIDRLAGSAPGNMKLNMSALIHALAEAGWVDVGRIKSRTHETKKQVYCAPEMAQRYTKSELRDLIEPAPTSAPVAMPLQRVK